MFIMNEIEERGEIEEKAAAQWALRQIDASLSGFDDEECEVSIPLVIRALETGSSDVKVAAIWELYRKACSNSWSQVEISESEGVTGIIKYLKSKPAQGGIQVHNY